MVRIPAIVLLQRKNGTLYTREDYLPSTANSLGELEVKKTLTQAQQVSYVRQRTKTHLMQLDRTDEGQHDIMAGYEALIYDTNIFIIE